MTTHKFYLHFFLLCRLRCLHVFPPVWSVNLLTVAIRFMWPKMAHENMAHSLQWIIEYNGLEHECLEICMFNEQCALAVDEMGKECEQKVVQQKKWYGAAKVLSWDHSNNKISHFSMSLAWLCVSDGYVHSCGCVCKSFNRSTKGIY